MGKLNNSSMPNSLSYHKLCQKPATHWPNQSCTTQLSLPLLSSQPLFQTHDCHIQTVHHNQDKKVSIIAWVVSSGTGTKPHSPLSIPGRSMPHQLVPWLANVSCHFAKFGRVYFILCIHSWSLVPSGYQGTRKETSRKNIWVWYRIRQDRTNQERTHFWNGFASLYTPVFKSCPIFSHDLIILFGLQHLRPQNLNLLNLCSSTVCADLQ